MRGEATVFKGKVVLITGAAGGIGRATARRFAQAGATVVATDLAFDKEENDTDETVRRLEHDVSSEASWTEALADVIATDGRLDVLVNNAGVSLGQKLTDVDLDDWRWVMSVNLDGAFLGMKHAIPLMREHGGSIVNISSALAVVGRPFTSAVSASKAGLMALTRTAAVEVAAQKPAIRVNAVLPGGVDTDIFKGQSWWPDQSTSDEREMAARSTILDVTPMSRLASPAEIAQSVLFLASDEASFITGSALTVDGGFTAL